MTWGNVITWVTNLAVIFGVIIAYQAFHAEQRDRQKRDKHRKETLETALWQTLKQIRQSAGLDLACYRPNTLNIRDYEEDPHVDRASSERQVQGDVGQRRSHVWTPLVAGVLDQALRESALLTLSTEQLQALARLLGAILRVNARMAAKNALLPAVVQGRRPGHSSSDPPPGAWAPLVADALDREVESDLEEIKETIRLCVFQ